MSKLSPNFSLNEFTFSQTAVRHNIDNTPPSDVLAQLVKTAHGMELIRAYLGNRSIRISSGYRSAVLNRKIGGAIKPPSAHTRGEAADFTVAGLTPREVVTKIAASTIAFDQLILEFDEWVHVGFNDNPRRQVLTAKKINGKTVYLPGIV